VELSDLPPREGHSPGSGVYGLCMGSGYPSATGNPMACRISGVNAGRFAVLANILISLIPVLN